MGKLDNSPFRLKPGVNSDDSPTAAEGGYRRAERIRWRNGFPEVIGGWQKRFATPLTGKCRKIFPWTDAARRVNEAYGTSQKLYVRREGVLYDITPATLPPGNDDGGVGGGYGMGLYGSGPYGGAASGSAFLRTWSMDRWGENLLALPRGNKLYRWANNTGVLPTPVADAPTVSDFMMKTPEEHVVLLGTQEQITGQFDPMHVRWSDQDNVEVFTSTPSNAAGGDSCKVGGKIMAGRPVKKRSLIWTDAALHEMFWTGDSSVYKIEPIGEGGGLIGSEALLERNGVARWVSKAGLMEWTGGAPSKIDCKVQNTLLEHIAAAQEDKIVCGMNYKHNEMWIFFPHDEDGIENSRYISWIIGTDIFGTGPLDRMAWIDSGVFDNPVAAGADGYIYDHEVGRTADGGPMNAFWESANIDLDDGEYVMLIDELLPDWQEIVGSAQIDITTGYEPMGDEIVWDSLVVDGTTKRVAFQAQGKWARIKVSTVSTPSWFRGGAPRLNMGAIGARR